MKTKDNEMNGTDGQKNTQGNSLFDWLAQDEPEAPRDIVEFHVLSALSVYRDDLDKANARGDWWKAQAQDLANQLEQANEIINEYEANADARDDAWGAD